MAPDLSQNKAVKLVAHAAANKYAICATCVYNVEGILASVRAAEAKRAPLIIQLFPWAVQYADAILVHAARINWLAPAFGNVHGKYGPKGPQLDYERLKRVHAQVGDRVSLVLHGAGKEYFQEKLLRECIDCGVAKMNINDGFNDDYLEVMREHAASTPLTGLIEKSTNAMQKSIEQYIVWTGGEGMADKM
ncbi:hypothetical protein GGP41_010655 [Bipolaris sorokiniana]|uniref:Fructose-bisphosphate aldolase n=1 Tax=Cochliobolus sativus TaxID=45130 RepID=A0A8H5ZKK7_COCSA|nr:hypothetical protein GGP41_010655 [Bipolaris sorokiniana]